MYTSWVICSKIMYMCKKVVNLTIGHPRATLSNLIFELEIAENASK